MLKFKRMIIVGTLLTIALESTNESFAKDNYNYQGQTQANDSTIVVEPQRPQDFGLMYMSEEESYISLEEVRNQMNYNMEINKPCGLSKEDFVELLDNLQYDYEGLYERNAEFIWEYEQEYQINGLFICSIIAIESGWGQHDANQNNYTGTMGANGKYKSFDSEEEGIEYTFQNLKDNYIDCGLTTIPSISPVYLGYHSDSWANNVYSAMKMIVSD